MAHQLKFFLVFFLSGILLFSCEDEFVVFKNAQPYQCKDLKEIPQELLGRYLQVTTNGFFDSISLFVEKKGMLHTTYFSQKLCISDSFNTSIIYSLKESKKGSMKKDLISYFEKNDTFYYSDISTTSYSLGKNIKLRALDSLYFLSLKLSPKKKNIDPFWFVCSLTLLKNGTLKVNLPKLNNRPYPIDSTQKFAAKKKMSDTVALKYYSSITPFDLSTDSSYFIINPDSSQLKLLYEKNLFGDYETYRKEK